MKAINLPHFKYKLRDLSRDLFLDHGWVLPDGLATYGNKSPLNFTLEEWQQAKRQELDPREVKQAFQQAWERCDTQHGLKNALEDRGYFLARGDRRGFVVLDVEGNIYSLSRWSGIKTKDVKAKLGSPENLPSVDDTQSDIRSKVSDQMRGYIDQIKDRQQSDLDPLRDKQRDMIMAHREERQKLKRGQEQRWVEETKTRSDRLNKGLRGLFDRLTGTHRAVLDHNAKEALMCSRRDQKQRDFMVVAQMQERLSLRRKFQKLRLKHTEERNLMANKIRSSLSGKRNLPERTRSRQRGPDFSL